MKASPTPIDQPVAPSDCKSLGNQGRFDRQAIENGNRGNFAQVERKRLIIRFFIKKMPKFLPPELSKKPETTKSVHRSQTITD